jgi:hypothetical protein
MRREAPLGDLVTKVVGKYVSRFDKKKKKKKKK